MTASGPKSLPAIGFLTVVEHAQHGLIGGYLVLNAVARPIEFHCTAPVKANRAQEILYGPTLRPYLYGEQIGGTLLAKAKQKPLWVCTDSEPVLAARDLVDYPLVIVDDRAKHDACSGERTFREGLAVVTPAADQDPRESAAAPDQFVLFSIGRWPARVAWQHESDRQTVLDLWSAHADSLDLTEPFDRIRDAIEEAQRMAA